MAWSRRLPAVKCSLLWLAAPHPPVHCTAHCTLGIHVGPSGLYSAPREYMGTVQRHCTRAPAPAAAQRIAGTGAPSAAQLSSDLRTVNTSRAARQSCYQHTHSPSPDSKQVNWKIIFFLFISKYILLWSFYEF